MSWKVAKNKIQGFDVSLADWIIPRRVLEPNDNLLLQRQKKKMELLFFMQKDSFPK